MSADEHLILWIGIHVTGNPLKLYSMNVDETTVIK